MPGEEQAVAVFIPAELPPPVPGLSQEGAKRRVKMVRTAEGPPSSPVGAGVAYQGFLPGSFSLELRFPGCLYLCIPGVLLSAY